MMFKYILTALLATWIIVTIIIIDRRQKNVTMVTRQYLNHCTSDIKATKIIWEHESSATHMKILDTRKYPIKKRPRTCKNCNNFNFTSIIQPKNVCSGGGQIDLLVLVTTVPKAVAAREAIRSTWLQHSKGNTANVRHIFLLWGGWSQPQQAILYNESAQYGDILQDDYKDAYYNLSLKMMSAYRWALKYCPHAQFTLRTADDNYINIPNILKWTKTFGPNYMRAQIGYEFHYAQVVRRIESKYYISYQEFPEKIYPPFAVGTAFLFSMAAIREVVQAAPNIPFFCLEDAWYGMVMREISMPVKHEPDFCLELRGSNLEELNKCKCPHQGKFFGLHLVRAQAMKLLWIMCPSSQL